MRSDSETLIRQLRAAMEELGDPARAVRQQAYITFAMPFYPIAAPDLRAALTDPLSRYRLTNPADWEHAIRTH